MSNERNIWLEVFPLHGTNIAFLIIFQSLSFSSYVFSCFLGRCQDVKGCGQILVITKLWWHEPSTANKYYYYIPTAHSLLWLVRSWSHDHLTKVILGCNIIFQHWLRAVKFMCSILNFNSWKGSQQKRIETRSSEEFGLLVKSWLGRELVKHIFRLNE